MQTLKQKSVTTISILSLFILCFLLVIIRWINIFNKDIYVITEKDGVKTVYEAFPIYEAELIDGADMVKSGGFSAFIPVADTEGLEIEIAIAK